MVMGQLPEMNHSSSTISADSFCSSAALTGVAAVSFLPQQDTYASPVQTVIFPHWGQM